MGNRLSPEQERLMRLKERQLSARDPMVKERKFQKMAAERERKRDGSVSLVEMWAIIPNIWKGALFAGIVGILLVALLPKYWGSSWATPIAVILSIVILMFSILIGRAIDLRDAIKKQL